MRRYILEVKSSRTRMLIKNMFVYLFVDPGSWERISEKQWAAEKGDIDF